MTLLEAYEGWQKQERNRQLYINTRDVFRKAWFRLPTNKPCSYYTRDILGEALAAANEAESSKVKAASVMIHVLSFANLSEPGDNPKPDFNIDQLMAVTRGTPSVPQTHSDTPTETKPPRPGRPSGRPPKPVAQIDPGTLSVIRVWPCMNEAERKLGTCKICRSVTQLTKSGGFYWCLADQVETFRARLAAKQQRTADIHKKDHIRKNRDAKPEQPESHHEPEPQSMKPDVRMTVETPDLPAAQQHPLVAFSDNDLFAELDRRGWVGEFRRTEVITIGTSLSPSDQHRNRRRSG